MATIAEELALLPFFSRVARSDLERAAPRFRRVTLAPNEMLWAQGSAVDELALILYGELSASAQLREIGRIRAPDIIGETGAFVAGSVRSATLKATLPTTLLALEVADLRRLRFERSRVYDALLDLAQKSAVKRISATNAKLAAVAAGSFAAPNRKEPGALVRLWRVVRPGLPTGECPPPGPLLRAQPGLRDMEGEVEEALAASFTAEAVAEGQVIVLEGEPGSCMYILAEGTVEVLRNVRGDRAELLTQLTPGQQFGANTLVESMARTASCVAAGPGWLYRMDRAAFDGLRGDARLLWRESVLATLSANTRNANAALEKALRGATPAAAGAARSGGRASSESAESSGGFSDLLRASGYLESMPANEGELAEMDFVVDEDHQRNRKNRGVRRP